MAFIDGLRRVREFSVGFVESLWRLFIESLVEAYGGTRPLLFCGLGPVVRDGEGL